MRSIALDFLPDIEFIETVQAMQRITCVDRAFMTIGDSTAALHFEQAEDALTFLETWMSLVQNPDEEIGLSASMSPANIEVVNE